MCRVARGRSLYERANSQSVQACIGIPRAYSYSLGGLSFPSLEGRIKKILSVLPGGQGDQVQLTLVGSFPLLPSSMVCSSNCSLTVLCPPPHPLYNRFNDSLEHTCSCWHRDSCPSPGWHHVSAGSCAVLVPALPSLSLCFDCAFTPLLLCSTLTPTSPGSYVESAAVYAVCSSET
jgi:hypothetical protein